MLQLAWLKDNPRGTTAFANCLSLTVICFLVLAARLYTRLHIVKHAGLDDALITVAWVFTVAFVVVISLQAYYGMGRHVDTLTAQDVTGFLKNFWASVILYNLGLCSAKISILIAYLRIFPHVWLKRMCRVMLGVVGVYALWTFMTAVLMCYPVRSYWDHNVQGKCLNHWPIWFFNATSNIVTDLIIIGMPIPALKSLQLPRKQTVALIFVFALGFFVCVVSCVRVWILYRVQNSVDWSYDNIGAAIWSNVEINVAIICASLPSLTPFLSHLFPKLFRTTGKAPVDPDGNSQRQPQLSYSRATKTNLSKNSSRNVEEWARDHNRHESFILTSAVANDDIDLESAVRPATDSWGLKGINVVKSFKQEVEISAARRYSGNSEDNCQATRMYSVGCSDWDAG